ncbi:RHS repeat domain-containing protein, partial [Mariniflexile ostreae]
QYTYDAGGERVIKSAGDSQNVAINGQTAATIVHTDDYTGYVSPYFVISKGKFTKHYFEGAGRIVSKLGNGTFAQPLGITAGGVNYTKLTAEQQKAMDTYVRALGVPPGPPTQQGIYATPEFTGNPYPSDVLRPTEENQEPPEGWPRNPIWNKNGDVPGPPVQFGPPVKPETVKPAEGFTGIGLPENDIFYFHPDHLGSTSYITAQNGSISQHVEYIAFGEILFEEHSSSFSSPYLFNGKELDRETNLSYYGARYLDMKTSLWLSVDPLAEKFYMNSPYIYVSQKPLNLIDPTGMSEESADDWIKNLNTGEVKWFDAKGKQAIDMAATHWKEGNLITGADNPDNFKNLGDSYFGPTKGNILDKTKILDQRKSYLQQVSAKINDKAGVNVGDFGNFNNITNEFLSSKFLGTPFGNKESNSGSDIPGLVWDYGISPSIDRSLKRTSLSNLAKVAIGMSATAVGYFLSSETAGNGSDMVSYNRANAINHFKKKTINFLDAGTLMKIATHKF